jgi:hypothetical protein
MIMNFINSIFSKLTYFGLLWNLSNFFRLQESFDEWDGRPLVAESSILIHQVGLKRLVSEAVVGECHGQAGHVKKNITN